METKFYKTFKSRLIFGKYSVKYLISKGSFGEVYFGTNVLNGKNYALKIEEKNSGILYLENECYILLNLKGPGIPSVISFGVSDNYNILVESLLGKSIWDIWLEKNKKFILKDVCIFAIQAISLLEYVHSKNYLHRDIKPANFLVGNPDNSQIYLIDFGNAKKFRSSKTGKHIIYRKSKLIKGALLFLSMNVFKGIETTRKDELESLGLVIIFLFMGSLPWSRMKFNNIKDGFIKIGSIRKNISIENICKGMPKEMNEYMNYINNLIYEQCPDYEYLRKLFMNVLKKIGDGNEELFSWVDRNKYRTISSRNSTSKNKKRNVRVIFDNLLQNDSNKINLYQNKNKQLNNNFEQIKKINKMKEIENLNIKKNNSLYNTDLNLLKSEKYKKININTKRNFTNNNSSRKENIKINYSQEANKKNIKIKKAKFPSNEKYKKNLLLSNIDTNLDNKMRIISKNKNHNNIHESFFPKEQNIYKDNYVNNHFNTIENAYNNDEKRNYINITNITNINNYNSNKSNISATIVKNNETQKLVINVRNNINQAKNIKNICGNIEQTLNNYNFRPGLYKPIYPNEILSNIHLSLYGLNLRRKYKITQTERNVIKPRSFNKNTIPNENAVTFSTLHNFKVNKFGFPKCKLYKSKFSIKID